ncbi:MAG: LysR family transcriptional regulator [Verrucomicrobia bacterium]|nr:LysR family transcriptional regulator [Verrucomicrobiota bacterium]
MNLSTFKIFRDLVETRSFSKSGALNSITQSAVSQQVAGLERRLKCLLVERGKKEFALTPEGRRFYEGSRTLTDAFNGLMAELQEMSRRITGSVRIATVYSIGLHELPPFLKQYLKQFPLVNVHVEYRRSNQVYEDVLENAADLGLVAFPEKRPHLEIKPFRRDRLVLICHPRHRLANFRAMPIQQIVGHKFVGFDPDIPTRKALDAIFKKHKITVEQVMEFDNIETLKRAVEIDIGVSMVPFSTVTQEVRNNTLKSIDFTDEEIFRPLGIISRRNRVLSPAIKAFFDVLATEPKDGSQPGPDVSH